MVEPRSNAGSPARRRAVGEGGFQMGTLFGVRLFLDWSVLIIFALILVNLGAGVFPAWHPDWSLVLSWGTALAAAVLFLASILAHELSHALVAQRHDIPVPRITLFLFGGMAHMEREPLTPKAEFQVAIIGPITSLVIGAVAIAAGAALAGPGFGERVAEDPLAAMSRLGPIATLLLWLGPINVLLGVFNLVPGFPLDGGRVLRSILWGVTGDLTKATRWASGAGRLVAWALMAWGLVSLMNGAIVQGIWLLLIGWFLNNAARQSYEQLVVREALRGVSLASVMRTRFASVTPDVDLATLVRDEVMSSGQRAFPVVDGAGSLVGLVCLADIRKVPQSDWPTTRAADVMTPLERVATLPASASATEALQTLADRRVDQVPVVADGRPVGLVHSQDLVKWISLHVGRGTGPAAFEGS